MTVTMNIDSIETRTSSHASAGEPSTHQRSERRISVHLPLKVRSRNDRGVTFEETTTSENLCRNGASFVMRGEVALGTDLEISIPFSHHPSRRSEPDFETYGRVVHIEPSPSVGEIFVGVQFIGSRFQRVYRSESTT